MLYIFAKTLIRWWLFISAAHIVIATLQGDEVLRFISAVVLMMCCAMLTIEESIRKE